MRTAFEGFLNIRKCRFFKVSVHFGHNAGTRRAYSINYAGTRLDKTRRIRVVFEIRDPSRGRTSPPPRPWHSSVYIVHVFYYIDCPFHFVVNSRAPLYMDEARVPTRHFIPTSGRAKVNGSAGRGGKKTKTILTFGTVKTSFDGV